MKQIILRMKDCLAVISYDINNQAIVFYYVLVEPNKVERITEEVPNGIKSFVNAFCKSKNLVIVEENLENTYFENPL